MARIDVIDSSWNSVLYSSSRRTDCTAITSTETATYISRGLDTDFLHNKETKNKVNNSCKGKWK